MTTRPQRKAARYERQVFLAVDGGMKLIAIETSTDPDFRRNVKRRPVLHTRLRRPRREEE